MRHLLWEIAEGEGYEKLKVAAHKGLKGLKVAPFYGCQILRPSKIMGFEDPDRPWSLERIIEACGGEAIDYPAKIKCCGFPIIQAREETGARRADPARRAGDGGGRRCDGHAVPALPPLPRRVAAEVEAATGEVGCRSSTSRSSSASPPGSRIGAEVQAAHRRSATALEKLEV